MYLQTRKQKSSCFLEESMQCVAAAELWPRLHQLFWDQAHLQQLQSSYHSIPSVNSEALKRTERYGGC